LKRGLLAGRAIAKAAVSAPRHDLADPAAQREYIAGAEAAAGAEGP
jgi:hypothetical protein